MHSSITTLFLGDLIYISDMRFKMKSIIYLIFIGAAILLAGCDENNVTATDDEQLNIKPSELPGDYGNSTSVVVYVNPVINGGTTETVNIGNQRSGIEVRLENGKTVTTDENGIAVFKNLSERGNLPIFIEGQEIAVNISGDKDQYNILVGYKNNSAEIIYEPIRYQYYNTIRNPVNHGDLITVLRENNLAIFLDDFVYEGDLEIRGNNICIIGLWDEDEGPLSEINGNVMVYGNNIRISGIDINGGLIVKGNNFEISYSEIGYAEITGENVLLLNNYIVDGYVSVTSNNVFLVGNGNL
jgi:hypothetical protein